MFNVQRILKDKLADVIGAMAARWSVAIRLPRSTHTNARSSPACTARAIPSATSR